MCLTRVNDKASCISVSQHLPTVNLLFPITKFSSFLSHSHKHDNKWLDNDNEEARCKGTSAQGAVFTSGTTTRTSQRRAKAKGKVYTFTQPVVIPEDKFELVMGLFEKVTYEKTKFLHHVCHHIIYTVVPAT